MAPTDSACVNAWPIGSGTIRRCGLAGVDVALEEMCHFGGERWRSPPKLRRSMPSVFTQEELHALTH